MLTKEPTWKIGPTGLKVLGSLTERVLQARNLTVTYLDKAKFKELNVEVVSWNLEDKHPFFECMTPRVFDNLHPRNPTDLISDAKFPSNPPPHEGPPETINDVVDDEECAKDIFLMFESLHESKVSEEGGGCVWPEEEGYWTPRVKLDYEDLYSYARVEPNVPYQVRSTYCTTPAKPHVVYYATFADQIKDNQISRYEVYILLKMMKGRVWIPEFSTHVPPVCTISRPIMTTEKI